jgi:hypothetical protein
MSAVPAMNVLAYASTLIASPPPDVNDSKYLDYLADDKQFMAALTGSMAPNHLRTGAPDAYSSIINAAEANVGNLSVEERAQIIQSARMIPAAGYRSDPADAAAAIVKNMERMSNNQGYTGPDAGVVVATTPAVGGDPKQITRGEILDNENFGNLVNSVFTAAGGKSSMPANLQGRGLMDGSMPGSAFAPAGPRGVLGAGDMKTWSEAERVEYLNKVAAAGRDGVMSSQECAELGQMAGNNMRNGDNEPTAVTSTSTSFVNKAGPISKDDLLENGTFEKHLNSIALLGAEANGAEAKALHHAIATADYGALGYDERVALVQAFNAATADNNVTAQEITAMTQMVQGFQKTSNAAGPAAGGTTLSNGLVVSNNDVAKPGNFMSMVNTVLDRSGVTTTSTHLNGTTYHGVTPFTNNQTTVPMLRSLDVAGLMPQERLEVLEMISQAASNGDVSYDEARAISERVRSFNPQGVQRS